MRVFEYTLGVLLEAAAQNGTEVQRVRALLNPRETLRLLPLEVTFRHFQGDDTPRRARLWNTLGYLFLEAENWDHDGGRFWREVTPICPIGEAADLKVSLPLSPLQVEFAAALREQRTHESRRQHFILRLPIHSAVEAAVSQLASGAAGSSWPTFTTQEKNAPHCSREKDIEIWFNVQDVALTALSTATPERDQDEEGAVDVELFSSRPVLRETLPGQTGILEYAIHRSGDVYELSEIYTSRVFDQQISWRYEFSAAGRQLTRGVYLPLDTLNILLQDQLNWSHWSWVPSKDPADLTTFCRAIQPSGEFSKIRQYLGQGANQPWHDAINAACKFDCYALIASCALHPRRNALISRRLKMARARTCFFRLFYRGGVMVGVLLKHAWAFGAATRPFQPTAFAGDLTAMTGKRFDPVTHGN